MNWLFPPPEPWRIVRDGNLAGLRLYLQHYSCRHYADGRRHDPTNPNRHLFLGPGEKLVLLTPADDSLFAWRKYIDDSGQQGVSCAIFRNTSKYKSSYLIIEAEKLARQRWPTDRFYTYVNPTKIKSTNPGCCFKKAGWTACGTTKRGLLILEKPWTPQT